MICLQRLYPVQAGSLIFNIGDDVEQVCVANLNLVAGNLEMEAVNDCRVIIHRALANPSPLTYRRNRDEFPRIFRNIGIPDEELR